MTDQRYDLFISYSHQDGEWVEKLRRRIESEIRHPKTRKKLSIFQDRENLRAGVNWKHQLQEAILDSDCVLAILSKGYATSSYCRMEWDFMEFEDPAALEGRILPVAIETTDLPAHFVRLRQYRDFSRAKDFQSPEFEKTFAELKLDIKSILRQEPMRSSSPSALSTHITGNKPFMALIEIADTDSRVMKGILNDVRNVMLKQRRSAKVLSRSDADDVCRFGEAFRSTRKIMDAIEDALKVESHTARRIFEWKYGVPQSCEMSVLFTTLSDSLIIHQIKSLPDAAVPDCTIRPVKDLLLNRKDFTAFPSIYDDIRTNLELHSGGGLASPTYVYGFQQMEFPRMTLASSRVLSLEIDKMTGVESARTSELSAPFGKGVMAFSDSVPLLNQLWFFPFGTFDDIYAFLDYSALFFHDYLGSKHISPEYLPAVVANLERISRLLGSQPLAGGAFESLIQERREELQRRRNSRVTRPEATITISRECNSIADFGRVIVSEFQAITGVELKLEEHEITDAEKYARIKFVMSFSPPAPTVGQPSAEFIQLMDRLARYVAEDRGLNFADVASVHYKPFMFNDAIMFIVKINWEAYENDEVVELWDLGA